MYLKLLRRLRASGLVHMGTISPLIVFYLYKVVVHGSSALEFAHAAVMVVFFIAIANGCINVTYFMRTASVVAALASVSVVFQYVCHYVLGFHLQLVPTSLLLPESEQWIFGAQTGLSGITGRYSNFYRPSAFFLEPSHLFIYVFPVLCVLLFAPSMNLWRLRAALLITLGLFLSTSGMGICVSAGLWMLYGGFYRGKENRSKVTNLLTPRNTVLIVAILVALMVSYFNIPFFNQSVNRIFGIDVTGTDAISGRVRLAHSLAQTLTGSVLWFGMKESVSDIEFNLSGYYATLLKYGISGTLLSYVFYVRSLFRLRAQYFWLSSVIILISFFTAHTHGTFFMLYFVVILMEGHDERRIGRHIAAFRLVPSPLQQPAAVARS